ncbi:type VI secretion protein [Streptomyces albidochromogenes]|uniref:Type VI secretion protein n=1 Tax=Streptomyces albidochromogenes TaxID=329524 RepID=A0ABW6FQP6_9ACTN
MGQHHHGPGHDRQGERGIPDSLLVGLLAFLLGLTILAWLATGLAGLFAHGAWPDGVTFARTPLALRHLMGAPHDIPAAWPDTPPDQLSGYGLFWGLLIGELMILGVLTIFVLGVLARLKAQRETARARAAADASEPAKAPPGHPAAPGPSPAHQGTATGYESAGVPPAGTGYGPGGGPHPAAGAAYCPGGPHLAAGSAGYAPGALTHTGADAGHGPAGLPHPDAGTGVQPGAGIGPSDTGARGTADHAPPHTYAPHHTGLTPHMAADAAASATGPTGIAPAPTSPTGATATPTGVPGPAPVPYSLPRPDPSPQQAAAPAPPPGSPAAAGPLLTADARNTGAVPAPRAPRLVYGGPEARRPTAVQAVLDAEGAALVVTSDPAVWAETKDARAKLGPVLVYDPGHLCDTPARLHWSPTSGCERADIAAARAVALLAPIRPQARLDAAMADTAETLLSSWLHAAAVDGRPFRQVHRWAQGHSAHEPVRILRTHPKASSGAAGLLESALTAYPERREVAQELTVRALAALSSVHIREACTPNRTDSVTLESFAGEGGTLYVVGEAIEDPKSRPGAMPLLTALTSSVVEHGRRMAARSSDGRLDPPMTFVLDDVAAVAPLPQLPELLSTGQDQGLLTLVLLRSQEQGRARWPDHTLTPG